MRSLACVALLVLLPSAAGAAQANRLDIRIVDGLISIHAEAVGLGRLLGMFDRVAGTQSTVPVELENRNVSVQFHGLDLAQAVRKIFEGLPLDYVVVEQEQIVVTAVSGTLTASAGIGPDPVSPPVQTPAIADPFTGRQEPVVAANPFQSTVPNPAGGADGGTGNAPAQPAVIQTPFGPLVNPRANTQPANPAAGPGQGSPFSAGPGAITSPRAPDGRAVFPAPPGLPANGIQSPAAPPKVFGNTAPAILELNNLQSRPADRSQP